MTNNIVNSIDTMTIIVKLENALSLEIPDDKTIELIGLEKEYFLKKIMQIIDELLEK